MGALPVVGVGDWSGVGGRVHLGVSADDHCFCCVYLVFLKVSEVMHNIY